MPIILVRHGESESNVGNLMGGWTDTPLTGLGLRQAEAVAARLRRELGGQPCRIVASDLKRAMQTAKIIGEALGAEPTSEPGLREINNGEATNMTKEEAKLIYREPTRPLLEWTPYPGAENWLQLNKRVSTTMDRVYKDISENLIVVGHGGSLHHVIFWWLRVPTELVDEINFGMGNTSITTLSVTSFNQRMLVRLNDTRHLDGLS
jgi:broad specificity phosphatase PhoE